MSKYYIDTGTMPPEEAAAFIKSEMKRLRVAKEENKS